VALKKPKEEHVGSVESLGTMRETIKIRKNIRGKG